MIFRTRAFSGLTNANTVASLSDIYSRKTKTEQLESQHDKKDAVIQAVRIYGYCRWRILKQYTDMIYKACDNFPQKMLGQENKGCSVFECSVRVEKLSISDLFWHLLLWLLINPSQLLTPVLLLILKNN